MTESICKKIQLSLRQVWALLEEVKDPEIPIVSVVEMGIIRQVKMEGDQIHIVMTPTFTGCPALHTMKQEIKDRLLEAGAIQVHIEIENHPAWSSDWITPGAREKLRSIGLAPPPLHGGNFELITLEVVVCPYCGSQDTSLKNGFGSTLCRAIFYCNACQQPFEQFKPL